MLKNNKKLKKYVLLIKFKYFSIRKNHANNCMTFLNTQSSIKSKNFFTHSTMVLL